MAACLPRRGKAGLSAEPPACQRAAVILRRVLVIGLMSGTSADGVDAALVEWPAGPETQPFRLLAFEETPLERAFQERIHRLAAGRLPAQEVLAELAGLDVELGERFAAAACALAKGAGVSLERIAAIA